MFGKKRRLSMWLGTRVLLRTVILLAAVLLLMAAARASYRIGYGVFSSDALTTGAGRTETITIEAEMTNRQIGKLLEEKELIGSSIVYRIQAKLYGYQPLPGTYELNSSMNIAQMVELMTSEASEDESEEDNGDSDELLPEEY